MYFIKANDDNNKWWQYVLTIFVTFFSHQIIGVLPLLGVIAWQMKLGRGVDLATFQQTYNLELLGVNENIGLILLLLPSVVGFFALWFMIRWIHHRKSGQIVSAENKIRWKRLFTSAGVWFAMLVVIELIFAVIDPQNYHFQFAARTFWPLLAVAFLFIPLQAWFEELLFRSYLMQGVGLLFKSRMIALLITAIAFGMLHIMNPEVKAFGLGATMPYYIGFGVFAGLLVVFDNGIELACGVHAIGNIYSAVFVTYQSSALQTAAMWQIKVLNPWFMNVGFLLMAILFILIMQRIYKWGNWRKLLQPIALK